jgi:hypothetical protein
MSGFSAATPSSLLPIEYPRDPNVARASDPSILFIVGDISIIQNTMKAVGRIVGKNCQDVTDNLEIARWYKVPELERIEIVKDTEEQLIKIGYKITLEEDVIELGRISYFSGDKNDFLVFWTWTGENVWFHTCKIAI